MSIEVSEEPLCEDVMIELAAMFATRSSPFFVIAARFIDLDISSRGMERNLLYMIRD